MALTQEVKESLWLGDLLGDIGALKHRTAIQHIQGHNQGALAITKNCEYQGRTKHIDIQYHFIPLHGNQETIQLTYCPTQKMTVDIFAKPLPWPRFEKMFLDLDKENPQITRTTNFRN